MNETAAVKLMEIALQKGADEAEVYLKRSKSLGIEVREQKIDTLESSVTVGYCLRVIKDKRLGFSYATGFDEMEGVAEKALESARYTEPDEALGLPAPGAPKEGSSVVTFDPAVTRLSETDAIDRIMQLEKDALDTDARITKIRKASGHFGTSDTYIVSSKGITAHYASTGCSAQIMVIAEQAGESQMGWDYAGSRLLSDVDFPQVGRNAAQNALRLLGARKITPVKGYILLDPSIVVEFLGILSIALSSESVQKKKSVLAGKKGEPVANERINITDNGTLDGKPGSKPVDDEGVPTTSKALIEKGILQGYLYNTYTARKENTRSTGNAVRRGAATLPMVGPTNLYLEPSSKEFAAGFDTLTQSIDRGLYVLDTMGMHTANPVSGEFSVGASGLWIEKGKVAYPVKEAIISGNILTLFKNAVMVGDDLRFYGNIGASSLLIENIDISA